MARLFSEERHEPLAGGRWDEQRARDTLSRIVRQAEDHFAAHGLWPAHPRDSDKQGPSYMLYAGACGTIWVLRYLQSRGAVRLANDYAPHVQPMLEPNREDFGEAGKMPFGSFLMGDTSIWMLHHAFRPGEGNDEVAALVEATMDHPTREYMWGAPGTLAAALFMHRQQGDARWADLFRRTARRLWSRLEWSEAESCHFWTQDLYRQRYDFIDAVHGFIGTAAPLIQGRDLLEAAEWSAWKECIARTTRLNAECDGALVNWRARLSQPRGEATRMQYCHGAPGFIVCLGDFPDDTLDDLLVGGGEAVWQAGPLGKGPQLCHGTAGNGYTFLKLYRRTRDSLWLDRARQFAMHAIPQYERELAEHGRPWFSLWTGHMGLAVYLWDCISATDRFPTVDVFFG